jgi:hypothetical protein
VKLVTAGLALVTLTLGIVAAVYWLRASRVSTDSGWDFEPAEREQSQDMQIVGLMVAAAESGRLNAIAALWTAAAALSGCVTTFVGTWPFWPYLP